MKQNQYLSYYIRLFLIQFLSNERGLVKIQFWHTGMH